MQSYQRLLNLPDDNQQPILMGSDIHTIVIGAGISGITAALEIARAGHPVLVLEAADYIGGRIKMTSIKRQNGDDLYFEEGASQINGYSAHNPITTLVEKTQGIQMKQIDEDSIIYLDEQGKDVTVQSQKNYDEYEKIIENLQDFKNCSVYDCIKKTNPTFLNNKYLMHHLSNNLQEQTSSPFYDLSAQHGLEDSSYNGKKIMITNGLNALFSNIEQEANMKVFLSHEVKEIQFDGMKNIVRCANGKIFQSVNVVISAPLGILKLKSIRFYPQLPEWKKQAINKIHYGSTCKLLVALKTHVIKNNQQFIGVIADDLKKRGLCTLFLNLFPLTGKHTLITYGFGASADQLEYMQQQQLTKLICSRLRVIVDPSITSNDFQIYKTSWRTNPFAKGTHSYAGVTTKSTHWENMAKPIFCNSWYFAGEHTISRYRGTIHGAYISGTQAALQILKGIHESNWFYNGKEVGNNNSSESSEKVKSKKIIIDKQFSSSSEDQI